MIYNFRHDKARTEEILRRIEKDKQISQGWGGGKGADLDLRKDDFVNKTFSYYNFKRTNIPSNLTRMREFSDGDMLVVPHLPEYGTVSVHIVDGAFPDCYDYDVFDDAHLNHRISLKHSFGLNGEISIYHTALLDWCAKLQSLRYPVLAIPEFRETFSDVVEKMKSDTSHSFRRSELDDFLIKVSKEVGNAVTKELRSMSASGGTISFEALCERLLQKNGYQIKKRHQYDRQGGDVDLICQRSRRDTSIFEGGDVTLFVQIKKHKGETDETAINQVLKMIEKDPHADGCVMSTADDFTAEAKRLAEDNAIVLLDRHEICRLLVAELTEYMGSTDHQ